MFTILLILNLGAWAVDSPAQKPVPSHESTRPAVSPTDAMVHVNGVALTRDRLTTAVDSLLPATSFHRNVDPQKTTELRVQALRSIVNEELVFQEGRKSRVTVSQSELDAGLARARKKYPTAKAFNEAMRRSGATLGQVQKELARALTVQKTWNRMVTKTCQPTDEDVATFYRENPQRFVMPEQLHIFSITVGVPPSGSKKDWTDARARAEQLLDQIKAGSSFETVARTYSTDPSKAQGGDMGWIHRGRLTDEFEAAAKTLAPGQVSPVIETLFGYHVIRLAEIRPPEQRSLDQVKVQLKKDLTAKRCEAAGQAWLASLRAKADIVVLDPELAAAKESPQPAK